MNPHDLAIFTGTAHRQLASDIARLLGLNLGDALVDWFDDGMPRIQISQDVREKDVYIIQPDGPPSDWFVQLLELVVAAKRSARRVTIIIPYYSSGRADRRDEAGKVISSALRAKLLAATNVDRVVLFDLHAAQIVGMFEAADIMHVDEPYVRPVMLDRWSKFDPAHLANAIASPPDVGRLKVVRSLYVRMREMGHPLELGVVDKDGTSSVGIEGMTVLGNFQGRHTHLFDDVCGTGSTAMTAARAVLDHGALDVTYWVTHMVLPDRRFPERRRTACERLVQSPISRIITTDTLPLGAMEHEILGPKLEVLSVAPLLALVIKRLHEPNSGHRLSSLFGLDGYRSGLTELSPIT